MSKIICGIYKIKNKINGKCYIGQSMNIKKRFLDHKNRAFRKNDSEYNSVIHKAIRKYGLKNFIFSILETCSPDKLNQREIYWIKHYNSYFKGYNQTLGGNNPVSQKGKQILSNKFTTSKPHISHKKK